MDDRSALVESTPPTRFVILFEGRTGSSYLVDALSSHPCIRADGEILDRFVAYRNGLDGRARRLSASDEDADRAVLPAEPNADRTQLYAAMDLLMTTSDSIRAVGFKTKLRSILDRDGFETLLRSLNVKIVHMVRDNVVKQVISSFNSARLYKRTGEWNLLDQSDALPAFTIDPAEFSSVLRAREQAEDGLAAFVDKLGRRAETGAAGLSVLTLRYEDILKSARRVHDVVQNYLGVAERELSTRVLKNTSDDLRTVVSNFDELRAAYRGTRYGPMFDEVLSSAAAGSEPFASIGV